MNVKTVIGMLARVALPSVFNPWDETDLMDACDRPAEARRERLSQHLHCPDPRLILIGEAPGYQGCHFSGVPFTNEKLVCNGDIPRVRGSWAQRLTSRGKPWCEPSATIMWGALRATGFAEHVIMWNAFAFHPHKPGEPYSNRAPTAAEVTATQPILQALLSLYPGVPVFAVGRVAARTLALLGVETRGALRHPSMGGANQFRAGLKSYSEGMHP